MITNIKGFKPGTTLYDKMQYRLNKYEEEMLLYKRIIQKNERDLKKKEEEIATIIADRDNKETNLNSELAQLKDLL
jgi:hypothetical protein